MGVVYRAVDERLKRDVALKFLPENLAKEERALSRLQREAEAASKLSHPNICTIYEIAEDVGRVFIAMELINGRSLKNYISGPLLSITETLDIAIQIADALDTAHESGVIHRDVKPANIMITSRGLAKVLDFGLAKLQHTSNTTILSSIDELKTLDSERLTRLDSVVGTTSYMSPEQAKGEDLDTRTDLFSFGILLYEMSTGSLPFRGANASDILHAIMEEVPTPVRQFNPDIPPELERIINKAMEKNRRLRYQRASEIRSDLQRLKRDIDSKWTDEEPIIEARILEAAAPKQCLVGRAAEILTVIRLPDSEGLRSYINEEKLEFLTGDDVRQRQFCLSFSQDVNGRPQPADVILKIDSPNFEPRCQSKRLKVPPKHDTEVCTFLLTPLLVGGLVVNLELLVGDQIVVSRSIRTKAEPEGTFISPEKVVVCVRLPLAMMVLPGFLEEATLGRVKEILKESNLQNANAFITPSTNREDTDLLQGNSQEVEVEKRERSSEIQTAKGKQSEAALKSLAPAKTAGSVSPPVPVSIPPSLTPSDLKRRKLAGRIATVFAGLAVAYTVAFYTHLGVLLRQGGNRESAVAVPVSPDRTPPSFGDSEYTIPPPMSEASGPVNTLLPEHGPESSEIRDLLKQLSIAFSDKSISELKNIWPQMGDEKKAIQNEFHSAETISRTFDINTLTLSPDRQTATVSGNYRETSISKGRSVQRLGVFHLTLVKMNGKWLIVKADFAPR